MPAPKRSWRRCRFRPAPQKRKSRAASGCFLVKKAAEPAKAAMVRTPRARRLRPTSRAANGYGVMAVSPRSHGQSPMACLTQRTIGARCLPWVGPNSRMPISRPWLPMYGRSATKRCIDKSGKPGWQLRSVEMGCRSARAAVKALHQPRMACSCSPAYMGGPAWQFKKFVDSSSRPCSLMHGWISSRQVSATPHRLMATSSRPSNISGPSRNSTGRQRRTVPLK